MTLSISFLVGVPSLRTNINESIIIISNHYSEYLIMRISIYKLPQKKRIFKYSFQVIYKLKCALLWVVIIKYYKVGLILLVIKACKPIRKAKGKAICLSSSYYLSHSLFYVFSNGDRSLGIVRNQEHIKWPRQKSLWFQK